MGPFPCICTQSFRQSLGQSQASECLINEDGSSEKELIKLSLFFLNRIHDLNTGAGEGGYALLPPDQISIGFKRTSLEKVMSTFKILEQTFVID